MLQSQEGPEEPHPDATFQSLFGSFSVGDIDIMSQEHQTPSFSSPICHRMFLGR